MAIAAKKLNRRIQIETKNRRGNKRGRSVVDEQAVAALLMVLLTADQLLLIEDLRLCCRPVPVSDPNIAQKIPPLTDRGSAAPISAVSTIDQSLLTPTAECRKQTPRASQSNLLAKHERIRGRLQWDQRSRYLLRHMFHLLQRHEKQTKSHKCDSLTTPINASMHSAFAPVVIRRCSESQIHFRDQVSLRELRMTYSVPTQTREKGSN